jgi:pimeloyl-ACP methyl ester carboxylesterase
MSVATVRSPPTPVIFVHGLQETGASWTPMIDSLRDDPWIRERYQFWFFSYPSGYPYPYSAALFRRELDGVKRAFPNHKRVVLIGHSMGGMICRLMITDAGDKSGATFLGRLRPKRRWRVTGANFSKSRSYSIIGRMFNERYSFQHRIAAAGSRPAGLDGLVQVSSELPGSLPRFTRK